VADSLHAAEAMLDSVGDGRRTGEQAFLGALFPAASVLTNMVPTAVARWQAKRDFAQQMRSNSALRSHANHHASGLLFWCDALLRGGSWWALVDGA
jgi:hypothetical protein